MNSIPFLSKSRGTSNLISRIGTILSRFGVFSGKYENLLRKYSSVTSDLDCVPTFPITAVTLKRHPHVVKELCQEGVEFAVHGYIHTDYGVLPLEKQVKHFQKAIDTFEDCQVPFGGFRAPFVRTNDKTFQALSKLGFSYDSSFVVHWDVLNRNDYSDYSWDEYERVLKFYKSRNAKDCLVLPRSVDGFVEIPVTMPDDEIMLERLGITDKKEISDVWEEILDKAYSKGELFTIQLHPERIELCENALVSVIKKAKILNPPVWMATLSEIAKWWKEREKFNFEIHSLGDGRYSVKANCSDRATILLKNCYVSVPTDKWLNNYESFFARDFILESPVRPVIGVSLDFPRVAVDFLQSEGYIVESSNQSNSFGIFLNNITQFKETDKKSLLHEIEQSDAPLLRYWRWPGRARSALSITGDIDSITLIDFVLRIFENLQQKWR